MTALNFNALTLALESLQRSIDVTKPLLCDKTISSAHKETLRAGVIWHFKFCYEQTWRAIRQKLSLVSHNASCIDALSYQDLIREAAKKSWIIDVQKWFFYRDERNATSNTDDLDVVQNVYWCAELFYLDAVCLLNKLKNEFYINATYR